MIDKSEKAKQIILLSAIDEDPVLHIITLIKNDLGLPKSEIYEHLATLESEGAISFYTYDDFDNIVDGTLESYKPALKEGSTEIFIAKTLAAE